MTRKLLTAVGVAVVAALGQSTSAQTIPSTPSASTSMLSNIRSAAYAAPTIAATNQSILQQLQVFGAPNTAVAAATRSSSISSTSRVPSFSSSTPKKPFANASLGSTISPYLNLFSGSSDGFGLDTVDNYNVLVRPQLQQQRVNQQVQRQQQQLNQRVQAISAQAAFTPQGSEQIMATGHQTSFGYYSRFYPRLNRR